MRKRNFQGENKLKIFFDLEIEEDGWPPIGVEILNGTILSKNKMRVENTPFFIWEIAAGDIVQVAPREKENEFSFQGLEETSGNTSISIIVRNHSLIDNIRKKMESFKCYCEFGEIGHTKMLALSIPREVDYSPIRLELDALEARGDISYAELCIDN